MCVVFSPSLLGFQKNSEVKHEIYFERPYRLRHDRRAFSWLHLKWNSKSASKSCVYKAFFHLTLNINIRATLHTFSTSVRKHHVRAKLFYKIWAYQVQDENHVNLDCLLCQIPADESLSTWLVVRQWVSYLNIPRLQEMKQTGVWTCVYLTASGRSRPHCISLWR